MPALGAGVRDAAGEALGLGVGVGDDPGLVDSVVPGLVDGDADALAPGDGEAVAPGGGVVAGAPWWMTPVW